MSDSAVCLCQHRFHGFAFAMVLYLISVGLSVTMGWIGLCQSGAWGLRHAGATDNQPDEAAWTPFHWLCWPPPRLWRCQRAPSTSALSPALRGDELDRCC